ncbi:hypothetical protein FS837_000943 [Tulasnella sp. UAMH 9824]|nr:hypothetical protein FS837_000943 [Tulasnella sp. UAMH 9824]
MPDNPATVRFLGEQDKVNVVKRIRINQNGIEAKVWKRYQYVPLLTSATDKLRVLCPSRREHRFIEAFTDPKAWFFFLFVCSANLMGGVGIVFNLIIKEFGYNTLQPTALSIPIGAAPVIAISILTILIKYFPNSRCILAICAWMIPSTCCFLLIFLPRENKTGFLVAFYLLFSYTSGFAMILSLVAVVFAGHTKKMTCNAIFLVGYSIGQMVSTQFWKKKYRPRNIVPWTIILSSFAFNIFIISIIRWYLVRENKRRDAERLDSVKECEEFGFVEHVQEDGSVDRLKVPIQFLDMTDLENKAFRYPL